MTHPPVGTQADREGLAEKCEVEAATLDTQTTVNAKRLRDILRSAAVALREVEGWRDIEITDELLRYVSLYGGFCRDCADEAGVCPAKGLPCADPAHDKAIRHVINALNYGFQHGFIAPIPVPQGQGGDGIHLLSFDDKRLGKTKITATPYSAEDLENLAQLLDTNIRTGHDIPSCFNGNTLSRLIAQCYRAFASPTPPPTPSTPDLAAVKAALAPQSPVAESVYLSAVAGRRAFRNAYRRCLPVVRAADALAAKWITHGQKVDTDDFYAAINDVFEAVAKRNSAPEAREDQVYATLTKGEGDE